ncbi:hypothetical protein [Vitreimonas flagellata]|nr:hypothetical protein [Vitreimonas flagellata]
MSIELLPSAWRWWQPIVFGFLAAAGVALFNTVLPIAVDLVGKIGD